MLMLSYVCSISVILLVKSQPIVAKCDEAQLFDVASRLLLVGGFVLWVLTRIALCV